MVDSVLRPAGGHNPRDSSAVSHHSFDTEVAAGHFCCHGATSPHLSKVEKNRGIHSYLIGPWECGNNFTAFEGQGPETIHPCKIHLK